MNSSRLLLLAPLLFAAHVIEETPGRFSAGYVSWFNSLVPHPLSEGGFVQANIAPLAILAVLAGLAAWSRSVWAPYVLLIWLTHFMFANGLFHLIATIDLRRYSPGVVTGTVLYLPFFVWLVYYLRVRYRASPEIIALAVLLAGLPMYIQTYMVVFRHARYF